MATDITNLFSNTLGTRASASSAYEALAKSGLKNANEVNQVDMNFFLNMIVKQLQNQDPLNPMDDSQFLSQMAQITTVTTLTDLVKRTDELIEYSGVSYAASLVGREVTVADIDNKGEIIVDKDGKIQTVVGTVTGAGLYNAQNSIFVNGKAFPISNVLAVGKIPDSITGDDDGGTDGSGGVDGDGGTDGSGGVDGDGGTDGSGGVDGDGGIDGSGGVDGDGGTDGSGGVDGDSGTDGSGGVDGDGGTDGSGGVDGGGTDGSTEA